MELINDIMKYGFFKKSFFTSIMVGVISRVIGIFIILHDMALIGDAISHDVLPGVAISFMLGINYFYGAVLMGVLAALMIGVVTQNSRITNASSIGIILTA